MSEKEKKDVRERVKEAYAAVAREKSGGCCGSSSCCGAGGPCASNAAVPEAELGLSCGDPVALSHLASGEVVLDLGSGGGKDVFLAAQVVGPTGRAIGVDMTPEMLMLAHRNARFFTERTGLDNVEFRQGHVENVPVDDASIDVVISNCVINLSPDKDAVFREIHRMLKPGGRMIVSDIVLNEQLPEELKNDETLYSACIAGALLRDEYLDAIRRAGFQRVELLADRAWSTDCVGADPITREAKDVPDGIASSITVLAKKGWKGVRS